jgi:DNA-binding NtrC family response regulator
MIEFDQKTVFISDRFSEFIGFLRGKNGFYQNIDLYSHTEANRSSLFNNFYELIIIDLHLPWLAIPHWIREQATHDYLFKIILIGNEPVNAELNLLFNKRIYRSLSFSEARENMPQVISEFSADMRQHKFERDYTLPAELILQPGLIGKTEAIKRIRDFIEIVSKAPHTPCLISGETGTGKTMCARRIHQANDLHEDLFFVKDCENTTTNELMGDLFGVVAGTDSVITSRTGLMEKYRSGTLVLKNIEYLPRLVQEKLLLFLEDHVYQKIGSNQIFESEIRLIGLTNQNLEWFVRQQKFNASLFFHLNAFEVHLPLLRERGKDIELLLRFYLQHYAQLYARDIEKFSPGAVELFKKYTWPGNILELKRTVEKIVQKVTRSTVAATDLPEHMRPSDEKSAEEELLGNCSIRDLEKRHIEKVLQRTKGNKSQASEILNISRTTLREKMRQYHLE